MSQEDLVSSGVAEAVAEGDDYCRTSTRSDLAEAVHLRTGIGRADAAKCVELVLDEIFAAIVSREDVKLSSFGAFIIRAKRERQGRNPKTGEGAKITARLVVAFKPSNVLRERVNNGYAPEWGATRPALDGDNR
jgi:integration host factor subunit alpha